MISSLRSGTTSRSYQLHTRGLCEKQISMITTEHLTGSTTCAWTGTGTMRRGNQLVSMFRGCAYTSQLTATQEC